jgi:hypothetical protein
MLDVSWDWARLAGAGPRAFADHLAVYFVMAAAYWVAVRHLARRAALEQGTRGNGGNAPQDTTEHTVPAVVVIAGIWALASWILHSVSPGGESHDVIEYTVRRIVQLGQDEGSLHFLLANSAANLASAQLFAVLSTGLCGAIIFAIVWRERPAWAVVALVLWLWNPLLLMSTAVGTRNDMFMLVLQLGAFWMLQRRHWFVGIFMLVLATQTQGAAWILAPIAGLWLVRQLGWQRALTTLMASSAAGLALSWHLYSRPDLWKLPPMTPDSLGPLLLFILAAFALNVRLLGVKRVDATVIEDENQLLWSTAALTMLLYLIMSNFWHQPWHQLWVLAPAVLLPQSGWVRNGIPSLALGGLWSNVGANFLPYLSAPLLDRNRRIIAIVLLAWLPPLLAAYITHQGEQARHSDCAS